MKRDVSELSENGGGRPTYSGRRGGVQHGDLEDTVPVRAERELETIPVDEVGIN